MTNYDEFELESNLSDEENERRLDLEFEFHSPYGDGECFVVSLKNRTQTVQMFKTTNLDHCGSIEIRNRTAAEIASALDNCGSIYIQSRTVEIASAPNVMLIKETIAEIEKVCGTRFNRKMMFSYFPREVKGKKLFQKWLEQ